MSIVEKKIGFVAMDAGSGADLKLGMQELWLEGRVSCAGALLKVRHVFRIDSKKPAEVVYAFGLPRDAALRRFKVIGEGFEVHSELREIEEAVRIYEEGIDSGSLSTLVRSYRDGLVNLTVGNLRPREEVAVFLELVAGVDEKDGGFRFRFPFTLAPSYHPEAVFEVDEEGLGGLHLPDSRFEDVILPRWKETGDGLHRVGFHLEVDTPSPLEEISSPSHTLHIRPGRNQRHAVRLATSQDVPNRDLVLDVRYERAAAVWGAVSGESEGRFVGIVPSALFRHGKKPPSPRKIVFLVDRSGSMAGEPLRQARRALAACLAALTEEDEFGLLAFDSRIEGFRRRLVRGSIANRREAEVFLSRLQAQGGTELDLGLKKAHRLLKTEGEIFLITDGQVFETERILKTVSAWAARVHALGIGSASQDRFLNLLSRRTSGLSRFVTPRERVDLAAAELFASVGCPVASGLQVALVPGNAGCIDPTPVETVFEGRPLVVYGRLDGVSPARLVMTWESDGESKLLELPLNLKEDVELYEFARLLHGARLLADLDSNAGARLSSLEKKALTRLSRQFGLASRTAALVAVLARTGDRKGDVPETTVVPVGMPEDTAFSAYFRPSIQFPSIGDASGIFMLAELTGTGSVLLARSPKSLDSLGRLVETSVPRLARAPAPPAPEEEGPLAEALECVSRIEPDGGMPGRDDEERTLFSAMALLAFTELRDGHDTTAFDPHILRLARFLSSAGLQLKGDKSRTAGALVAKLEEGRSASGWIAQFLDAPDRLSASDREELWRKLTHFVEAN